MKKRMIIAVMLSSILLLMTRCQKNESLKASINEYNINATVRKMVETTENYTSELKLRLENERIRQSKVDTDVNSTQSSWHFDKYGFVQNELQNYCNTLIASEPNYVFNENFQINAPDDESWENAPDVFTGSSETLFSQAVMNRFDKIASDLEGVESNSMYIEKSNFDNEVEQIEHIIESNRNTLNQDATLSNSEKEALNDALFGAKALVKPQLELLNVLMSHAQSLDTPLGIETFGVHEVNQSRRTFFGKLIRAVARVAIAVAAVTVATAVIVVGAKVLLPASKFALKVKNKGVAKSIFKGVGKKVPKKNSLPGQTTYIKGSFVTPGSLYFGGLAGIVKSGLKWDDDMSLKYWYKEFEFKTKAKP